MAKNTQGKEKTLVISSLNPSTKYYVRAHARTKVDRGISKDETCLYLVMVKLQVIQQDENRRRGDENLVALFN